MSGRDVTALDPGRPVLVTGAAGFIGYHLSQRLLADGATVVGVDNMNDYYDPGLKQARLARLRDAPGFRFAQVDIADRDAVADLFASGDFEIVAHLAAQAGVRYSLEAPLDYADSNLTGFVNILEGCRRREIRHLLYASSSSVYGGNRKLPFSTDDAVDHPLSLYAATKKANELMAHAYSHLYGLPTTGLRFFTVYGPYGRPDMAYYKFADAIAAGRPIDVYNHGNMKRDFTYIDDVIEGVVRLLPRPPEPSASRDGTAPGPAHSWAPFRLYNIGAHRPEPLMDMIGLLERHLGRIAQKTLLPMQPGDVEATFADCDDLEAAVGALPTTTLEDGIGRFVAWYRDHHGLV